MPLDSEVDATAAPLYGFADSDRAIDGRRIYGTRSRIDVIDGKLWIQQDGTEAGVADERVALGIPKQQILLGFKPSDRRKITAFAVS